MKRLSSILIICSIVSFVASAAFAGEETTIDGVLHVKNGATPSEGVETLVLEELWRAGGEDDEVFFGLITQVLVDDDGNVYLLDSQLNEVQVYSPDGENIKTLSREGDGPGEIRRPADMIFLPDGTLGIVQSFPGKIVKVDLDGNPAGTIEAGAVDATQGGVNMFTNAAGNADYLVITGLKIAPSDAGQNRTNFIASFDLEGNEKVRFHEYLQEWDFGNFELSESAQYFPHGRYTALADDGRLFTTPLRNAYEVRVYLPDGTLDRVIEREYETLPRDEQEMDLINAAMASAEAQFPFEIKTSVETTQPDISLLHAAPDGSLWVLTGQGQRNQDKGVLVTYDVFDVGGHFVKQVAIVAEGDGRNDFLMFAGEDRVILVAGLLNAAAAAQGAGEAIADEEAEPMEIVCYEY